MVKFSCSPTNVFNELVICFLRVTTWNSELLHLAAANTQAEISALVLSKPRLQSEKNRPDWSPSMTFKGSLRKCLSESGPSRRSPGLEMLSATGRSEADLAKHPERRHAGFSVTYLATASKTLGDSQPSDGGGGTTHCAVPGKFALLWVAASVSRRRASYRRPPGAAPEDSQVNQTAAAILLKHNVSFLH